MIRLSNFVIIYFSVTNLFAQYNDDYQGSLFEKRPIDIPKGANLIEISTNQTVEENYISFGKYLVSKGYTFESKDEDFLVLITQEKRPNPTLLNTYKLNISFIDHRIIIRPKQSLAAPGYQLVWTDWHYAKSNGNVMKQSFDDFFPVLKGYGFAVVLKKE